MAISFGRKLAGMRGIRVKLTVLLLLFGLVPVLGVFAIFASYKDDLRTVALARIKDMAGQINDTIDRNLFERYGDVQAFLLNTAVLDRANWRKPGPANPLIEAMDGYMAAYSIYKLMLLVDPAGNVLAVNDKDATGKPLATAPLYSASFAGAPWLKRALAEDYLKGPEGLTGTVVEPVGPDATLAKLYGDDGWSIPFAAPLKGADGKIAAVWVNFADFGLVEQIVADAHRRLAADGMAKAELTLLDRAGTVLVDYDPLGFAGKTYKRNADVVGKLNLAKANVEGAVRAIAGETGANVSIHARKKIAQATGYAASAGALDFPGMGWAMLVRIPVEQAFAAIDRIEAGIQIFIAAALAAMAAMGLLIGTLSVRPINALTGAMRRLAGGDTSLEVPVRTRADELGEMGRAVQVFKENALEAERLRIEAGAAEAAAEAAKAEALRRMAETVESETANAVAGIAANISGVQHTTDGMAGSAETMEGNSQSVAAAAEQALANVQTVSSAAEELSASIQEIAAQIGRATNVTREAVESSTGARGTIQSLSDSVARIGDVTKLIGDIAGQTNLLALNATIEAARAGEAGKGFAVVAAEVKNLANQTSRSTDDINRQIQEIQNATKAAVQAVADIGGKIEQITAVTTAVAAAIEEQGSATQEISRNVGQTADAAREVTTRIAQVASESKSVGRQAQDVRGSVAGVTKNVEDLKRVLVRVVRTSTVEADRRATPRVEIDAAGALATDRTEVRVSDISAGGAAFSPAGSLRSGSRDTLRVAGFAAPLAFRTLAVDGDVARVAFDLDKPANDALAEWLAGQGKRRA